MLSVTETTSLLPSPLLFPAFGHRDHFSVTFPTPFPCFRSQRPLLCYLLHSFSLLSVTEASPLLPSPLLFPAFGHRDLSSVTFSTPFLCFRSQRPLLCYLLHFFSLLSVTEGAPSLLPPPPLFIPNQLFV